MPLQWSHSLFWPGDGVVGPEPEPSSAGTYPRWQSVVTTACALLLLLAGVPVLAVVAPPAAAGPRVRGPWARFGKRCRQRLAALRGRIPDRIWLLWRLVRILWSPQFREAQRVVREVAHAPYVRQRWAQTWRIADQAPGLAENLYRHALAAAQLRPGVRTAHLRNVSLELAYLCLKERGR